MLPFGSTPKIIDFPTFLEILSFSLAGKPTDANDYIIAQACRKSNRLVEVLFNYFFYLVHCIRERKLLSLILIWVIKSLTYERVKT